MNCDLVRTAGGNKKQTCFESKTYTRGVLSRLEGKRVETGLGLEFKDQTWQDQRKDLTWYFTFKELTSTWDKGLETGLGTALKRLDSDLSSKIRLDIDLGRKT